MSLKNKIRENLYQAYIKKETKKHVLQYLFLEITKRCNLNCLHCGSDCTKIIKGAELTTESWFKIIDYFKEHYSQSVCFVITGGEPLVHKNVFDIGKHIHNTGLKWGIVSNGLLLNIATLNKLISAGISSVTLSLDGTMSSHNWLRNHSCSFEKVIQALSFIGLSNITHKDVVTCVSPKNINELDEIAQLLIKHNIPDWRLFRIFPSGRAMSQKDLELSFEQTNQLLDWIEVNKPILLKQGLNLNMSCEGWVPFNRDIKIRDNAFFCRSGINVASILSDGTITGCNNNHSGFYQGNILTDNFANLWENHFEAYRNKNWIKNTTCGNCEHLKNRTGGSMHLWDKNKAQPNFCYVKKLNKNL